MSHSPKKEKSLTKIRQMREKRGMTQGELAKRVDVTEATINNWEKKQPTWLKHMIYLADALGCDLADLMDKEIIAKLRVEKKLSRRQLADRVGVKENTIAKWELEGLMKNNLEKLLRLCLALECASSPESLLDFFEKKQKFVPLTGFNLVEAFKAAALSTEIIVQKDFTPHPSTSKES